MRISHTITVALIHDGNLHGNLVPWALVVLSLVESTFPAMTQVNKVKSCGQPGIRSSNNENLEGRLFFETRHDGDHYSRLW